MNAKLLKLNQLFDNSPDAPEYDSEVKMVKTTFSSPGYHTTLMRTTNPKVHPTFISAEYAYLLLECELEEFTERAIDILEVLVSLQDTNPNHNTYGIWPWFYEEPLEQMSPPDWNWADFIGKMLVLVESRHSEKLPASLRLQIREAVFHASNAIIIRNMGPHYTNIAIMGSFVTIMAGELYNRQDYLEYGLERLDKFYKYTMRNRTFNEHNSPPYTTVAIEELYRLYTESKLEVVKLTVNELLEIAWKTIVDHYHPTIGQWTGPHSRLYSTLLPKTHIQFLKEAPGCPLELRELLHKPLESGEKVVVDRVYRVEGEAFEQTATAWMNPVAAIGSFDREIMWNQRRNVIGYFNHEDGATYAHLRFLRNGYDFSTAFITSAQDKGTVLFGLQMITNGGATHPNLDRVEGVFDAEDLRIRLEIGGITSHVKIERSRNGVRIDMGEHQLELQNYYVQMDGLQLQLEIHEVEGKLCVDYVLHTGEQRQFDLHQLEEALLVFALSYGVACGTCLLTKDESTDMVHAQYSDAEGRVLSLELLAKPTKDLILYRL